MVVPVCDDMSHGVVSTGAGQQIALLDAQLQLMLDLQKLDDLANERQVLVREADVCVKDDLWFSFR